MAVIDGDTIKVRMGWTTQTVRLIGVDAPETKHPLKGSEAGGRRATRFARRRLFGRKIRLVKDPVADTRDRYGRLLRYVYLEGENFNATLIRQGYARAYRRFPYSRKRKFLWLEGQAKRAGRSRLRRPRFVGAKRILFSKILFYCAQLLVLTVGFTWVWRSTLGLPTSQSHLALAVLAGIMLLVSFVLRSR